MFGGGFVDLTTGADCKHSKRGARRVRARCGSFVTTLGYLNGDSSVALLLALYLCCLFGEVDPRVREVVDDPDS